MPSYGRYQVAEPPSAQVHLHMEGTLSAVSHPPRCPVLDQEDLIAQGIDTSKLVPGAQRVNALGSCTAQTTVAKCSSFLPEDKFVKFVGTPNALTNSKACEERAIIFYHQETFQTGDPGQEWPPSDCGSSGVYMVSELKRLGLATGSVVANGAQNIVSLLQRGSLMAGTPFLYAWESPGSNGMIDGDGSNATLQAQIAQGVAGGHEWLMYAIVKLAFHPGTDIVDPYNTILRCRNSWSKSWGDNGDFECHLSTWVTLGSYSDFRLLV